MKHQFFLLFEASLVIVMIEYLKKKRVSRVKVSSTSGKYGEGKHRFKLYFKKNR